MRDQEDDFVKEVIIIFCCDTEPDEPRYGGMGYDIHLGKHTWKGIEEGIPKAKKITNSVKDVDGCSAKVTWFLRSDDQMNELYGNPAWMVTNFRDLWRELEDDGDEIGWHPHLWRWNESIKSWYPELEDVTWIEDCLKQGYDKFPEQFELSSCRMCWNFHSNVTMNMMNKLELTVDISALPGQKSIKSDFESTDSTYYDWEITQDKPYFPSQSDYRREANTNEQSLNILEIPITPFQIPLPWRIKRVMKKMLRPNKGNPIGTKSHLKTVGHPYFFKMAARNKFLESKENNCTTFFVSYFHADEFLVEERLSSLSNFKYNLEYLTKASKKYGVPFRFLTAKEAAKEILK